MCQRCVLPIVCTTCTLALPASVSIFLTSAALTNHMHYPSYLISALCLCHQEQQIIHRPLCYFQGSLTSSPHLNSLPFTDSCTNLTWLFLFKVQGLAMLVQHSPPSCSPQLHSLKHHPRSSVLHPCTHNQLLLHPRRPQMACLRQHPSQTHMPCMQWH